MRTTATLQLLPTQAAVAPGGRVEISLIVTNSGELVDRYGITVSGVPPEWCEIDQSAISLLPGDKATVHISVQPPSGTATAAGLRPLTINATSNVDELAETSAEFFLTIQSAGALQFDLVPKRVVGRAGQFRARMDNQANSPSVFSLMAQDAEDGLNFLPDTEGSIPFAPGEKRTVGFAVQPKNVKPSVNRIPTNLRCGCCLRANRWIAHPTRAATSGQLYVHAATKFSFNAALASSHAVMAHAVAAALTPPPYRVGGERTTATRHPSPISVVPTRGVPPTLIPTVAIPTIALPDPAVVKSFGITALPDGSVQVNWATSGADQVVLDNTLVGDNGQETLHLTSARTLILSVTNASGTVSRALILQPPQTQATGNAIVGARYLPGSNSVHADY